MNQKTLYESSFEHDNCGIGAITNYLEKRAMQWLRTLSAL